MSNVTRNALTGPGQTLTCPWCGAEDQLAGTPCQGCRRNLVRLPWWAEGGRKRKLLTRKRLILSGVFLFLSGLVVWLNYPFFPDPIVLLFRRPTTELTSSSPPGQWSMDGGDISRTRYVSAFASQPVGRVLWSQDLGEPTLSAPIVAEGTVYVGGHFKILAMDAETGAIRWERETAGPVDSSAAAAGDNLYLGMRDGRLVALDPETGETRWEFRAQGPFTSSTTVARGIVYAGSRDRSIYGIDAANGRVIWRSKTEGEFLAQPAISDGVLVTADHDHHLYVLNARTGQKHLVFRTAKPASDSPVAAHGLAYFPADGSLYAVDTTVKEIPWQYQFNKVWTQLYLWQVPGVPQPSGQQGAHWRFSPDGASSSIVASPAVTEEALYVGDLPGNFYALDPLSATELWRFQAEGGISTSPVVVGDRVYFGTQAGFLYALDRSNGKRIWRVLVGAPVFRPIKISPAFSNGRLYVRTSDGQLHAIE